MTTKEIDFTHAEILNPALKTLDIQATYSGNAIFTYDGFGVEREVHIRTLFISINGERFTRVPVPEESQGSDARQFLALMREAARRALWLSRNPKEKPSFAQMFGRKDDDNEG